MKSRTIVVNACLAALAFLAACNDRPYMTQDCTNSTTTIIPILAGKVVVMVPQTQCVMYGPEYCYDPKRGERVNAELCKP